MNAPAAIDPEFLAIFLEEALDILAAWEKACIALEKTRSQEDCDGLFRAAHSLKGGANSIGLQQFGAFVHMVEDTMGPVQKGKAQITPPLLRIWLRAQEILAAWVAKLGSESSFYPSAEIAALTQEMRGLAGAEESRSGAEHTPPPSSSGTNETDAAVPAPGEPATSVSAAPAHDEIPVAGGVAPQAQKTETQAKSGRSKAAAADATIRVSINKLETLMQLVGELSIQQSIVSHARQSGTLASKSARDAMNFCRKITKDIQGHALSLRMQRPDSLFQRLERTALDIARDHQKKLNVIIGDGQVELDRTVIERVTDPLVHIIRNAVDHGVETAERRVEAGKPETACVQIQASQSPGGVVIRISDDGKGLDEERLLRKAIDNGLVGADVKLSKEEIHQLILLPGFSTAEKVTDLSGRGVGMDVVKRAIDEIGGSLEISSTKGQGTTFSILLPTSLSIIDALIIEVEGSSYAVPVQGLAEILDLSMYRVQSSSEAGAMISLRGAVVPVEPLSRYLPMNGGGSESGIYGGDGARELRSALLAHADGKKVAFLVDRVVTQQDVVVRKLAGELAGLPGFGGSTIFGDGEPGLIINVESLARHYLKSMERRHGHAA